MKQKSFHIPFSSKTTYEKFKKAAKVKGLILPVAISEAMELWMERNKRKKCNNIEKKDLNKVTKEWEEMERRKQNE